jgi:predicted phosphoribosyltransferase
VDRPVIQSLGISSGAIEAAIAREQAELARRERLYRGDRPPLDVTGKTVILVDDGLATGSTMRAAVAGLRQRGARRIVVGVPIASPDTCEDLAREVDDIVCAATPEPFVAVGLWYENFEQTSDEEVRQLLEAAERELGERGHGATPAQGP